jgi:hypothetical protein
MDRGKKEKVKKDDFERSERVVNLCKLNVRRIQSSHAVAFRAASFVELKEVRDAR